MIIKGKVIKARNGNNIPFIPVFLDDLNTPEDEKIISYANLWGEFYFNVPEGKYTLQIRDQFYQPYSEVIQGTANRIIKLNKGTI